MKQYIENSFFICATEQSGDNIAEKIINQLNQDKNIYTFDGVGGSKIAPLLKTQFYSINDFRSIGIFEIIGSINKYLTMINKLSNVILQNKYNIIITIDSPDFNYRLAKKIKQKGFKGKIIHIVAPTVWAWRKNRAKDFANVFDKLLVIFPFEEIYFNKYNLNTKYIGHPIYYIKNYNQNIKKKYIAFLPGSREGEILSLIQYFKTIVDYIDLISLDFKIFIPTLPHLKKKIIFLSKNWKKKPIIEIDSNKIDEKFLQTSIAIVCSGTASLEISKRNIPQIVIYKLNIFTEIILKFFIKKKQYANIINIMSNEMIIPEIVNSKLNKKSILIGFKKLLQDYFDNNKIQIDRSKKIINKLLLENSPAKIASIEIKKLFFPKPFKD